MPRRPHGQAAEFDFFATNRKTQTAHHPRERFLRRRAAAHYSRTFSLGVTVGDARGPGGSDGSGKTTLLRLMRADIKPESGKIRRADGLRIVYFDQNRELDPDITLRRALAPDSDAVIYQDRVIHVASWAERIFVSSENLNQRGRPGFPA